MSQRPHMRHQLGLGVTERQVVLFYQDYCNAIFAGPPASTVASLQTSATRQHESLDLRTPKHFNSLTLQADCTQTVKCKPPSLIYRPKCIPRDKKLSCCTETAQRFTLFTNVFTHKKPRKLPNCHSTNSHCHYTCTLNSYKTFLFKILILVTFNDLEQTLKVTRTLYKASLTSSLLQFTNTEPKTVRMSLKGHSELSTYNNGANRQTFYDFLCNFGNNHSESCIVFSASECQ